MTLQNCVFKVSKVVHFAERFVLLLKEEGEKQKKALWVE